MVDDFYLEILLIALLLPHQLQLPYIYRIAIRMRGKFRARDSQPPDGISLSKGTTRILRTLVANVYAYK